jgi:hypothetical protein
MVTSKWIYEIKHAVDGSVKKYKLRSVARGFPQTKGVVYNETLYPEDRVVGYKQDLTSFFLDKGSGCDALLLGTISMTEDQ